MHPETGKLWRLTREYVTHAAIGGVILLLTGFVPEEFLVHLLSDAHISEGAVHLWGAGIDVRVVAVVIGMSVIVGDLVLRRRMIPIAISSSAAALGPVTASRAASSRRGPDERNAAPTPPIHYCMTSDGVRLAYTIVGEGPAFVVIGHWVSNLQMDWSDPFRRNFLERLGRGRTLLCYDPRGSGMSDRKVDTISFEVWLSDLETVIDASGLGRFAVYGASQTSPVAIAYAAKHNERLTRLVLYGGHARGAKRRPGANLEEYDAMITLTRFGWDRDDPAFRQMWMSQFMPGATKDQFDAFTEMARKCISGEAAARTLNVAAEVDVFAQLSQITAPTLVLHVRGDLRVPFECSQEIAAGIRGARLVALPGQNHILQSGEPAEEQMLDEIDRFLRS